MASNQVHKGNSKKSAARGSRRVAKKAEEHGYSMSHLGEQASHYWQQGTSQMREMTREREGTALLVALAAGFGVGLVVGSVFCSSSRPKTMSQRLAAEGIGHRLLESIEGMIPTAISDRLHS